MSPAAKSKSKGKSSTKAAKEQKSSVKLVTASTGSATAPNAYNPASGTFHSLETMAALSAGSVNGRFRSIDDSDDRSGSSLENTAEYDSASNNDSCSGESEDTKEKPSFPARQEPPPGSVTNEKRDKIRQKNERKHQRQKERRAQELHSRCMGYLMSWKLESLSQQLVTMGFTLERATMALILNKGRVEESVAWLLEVGDEAQAVESNVDTRENLKIDISEELARMADMEMRFKVSLQEIERAVVASEGNLEKATDVLRSQKQEAELSKPEEPMDPPNSNGSHHTTTPHTSFSNAAIGAKPGASAPGPVGKKTQGKTERVRPPQPASVDKKLWPSPSNGPSASYPLATTTSASGLSLLSKNLQAEAKALSTGANESKTIPNAVTTLKEPVIVMQRPQSVNLKRQSSATVACCHSPPAGWNAKGGGIGIQQLTSPDGVKGDNPVATNTSAENPGFHHHLQQGQYQPFMPSPVDAIAASWNTISGISKGSRATPDQSLSSGGQWNSSGSSMPMSSISGLFTGWNSSGSTVPSYAVSAADWNRGRSMVDCDYTNIDWSLTPSACISRPNQSRQALLASNTNTQIYEPFPDWKSRGSLVVMPSSGLQDGSAMTETSASIHDWTSPFAGKDLFSLPRQIASFPSL